MKILLIRHGESVSNNDTTLHQIIPDHEISLSPRGINQAEYVGEYLKAYFDKEFESRLNDEIPLEKRAENYLSDLMKGFGDLGIFSGKQTELPVFIKDLVSKHSQEDTLKEIKPIIKLYHSSYRRARQTKDEIVKVIKPLLSEIKEEVLLIEENHGIFDGLCDIEMEIQHPKEFATFNKNGKHSGKFYARYPDGESPFDVVCRLRQFFHDLRKDEENGVDCTIIVAHGIVIKAFAMAWLNKTPEWYEEEKSPGNCAIRVLEGNKDHGYIYGGHRNGNAWNYDGNDK